MNIAVCLKVVPDLEIPEVIDRTSGHLNETFVSYEFDRQSLAALEMALRLKQKHGAKLFAVVVGPEQVNVHLHEVYALGVDQIYRIWHECLELTDAHGKALVVSALLEELEPTLIFCGNCSSDTGHGQFAAYLAESLQFAQVTGVAEDIQLQGDNFLAYRRLQHGAREKIQVELPAVVAVDMQVGGISYSPLDQYLATCHKPIEEINLFQLGLSPEDISGRLTLNRLMRVCPPNPIPQAIFTPDSRLDPLNRIRAIVSGGLNQKSGEIVEGSPGELAEKALQFLIQRGFI